MPYAQSLTGISCDSCKSVGSIRPKTLLGGLLLLILSTEPPELQMRMSNEGDVPGATLPKSIRRLLGGNQPPSPLLIEKFATGAVEAEPSKIMLLEPPVVRSSKKDA